MLINFGLFSMIARYLGPASFGSVAFLLAIERIFQTFAQFGVDNIFQKIIRRNPTVRNFSDSLRARQLASLASLALLIVYAFVCLEGAERRYLLYFSFVFVTKHWELYEAFLLVKFQHNWVALCRLANTLVFAGAQILAVVSDAGVEWIVLSFVLESTLRPIWAKLAVSYLGLEAGLDSTATQRDLRWRALVPLALTAIVGVLFNRQDFLIIERFLGKAELGAYAIGVRLQNVFINFPTSVISVYYPRLLSLERNPEAFQKTVVAVGALVFFPAVLFSATVSVLSGQVLFLIGGADFVNVGYDLGVYIWALPFFSLTLVQSRLYLMRDCEAQNFVNASCSFVFALISYLSLVKGYGLHGVAVGYLITRVASNLLIPALVPQQRFYLRVFLEIVFPWRFVMSSLAKLGLRP